MAVLQGGLPLPLHDDARHLLDLVDGEEVGGGQAAGERDDTRLDGELQKLADLGALHALGGIGKEFFVVDHGILLVDGTNFQGLNLFII
ncbi:MAG: hypothetical protein NTZ12_04585 [Candidatus Aminicenantes bacterium]|nr:hypothetical protein [Candidatus Aminicenantes bacterium]